MENGHSRRYIIAKARSEFGKQLRKQYKGDKGVPYQAQMGFALRLDRICTTIMTLNTDHYVLEILGGRISRSHKTGGGYHQHYEGRTDGSSNTITSVEKDNYIVTYETLRKSNKRTTN